MKKRSKQVTYVSIVFVVTLVTTAIAATVIYDNLTYWSHGPVHWHADFTIVACGTQVTLPSSHSLLTTEVGNSHLHHHGDMRVHVEGAIRSPSDVTLQAFFRAIGGDLEQDTITYPTETGTATWKDGDRCPDGHAGRLTVFINDKESSSFVNYIISPYFDVPPGDQIRFEFN